MDWLHEPLKEIFGIPTFWVQRAAKIVQFLSGTVIVLEIVGEERVEEWANSVRGQLESLASAQPLKDMAANLWDIAKWSWLYLIALPGTKREDEMLSKLFATKYNRIALKSVLPLSIVGTIIFSILNYSSGWSLLWKIPLTLLGTVFTSIIFVYLFLFLVILIIIIIIIRPVEWLFDLLANVAIGLLKRTKLSRLALLVSLIFLVLGAFFELLAS